jgi:hypothetical protein
MGPGFQDPEPDEIEVFVNTLKCPSCQYALHRRVLRCPYDHTVLVDIIERLMREGVDEDREWRIGFNMDTGGVERQQLGDAETLEAYLEEWLPRWYSFLTGKVDKRRLTKAQKEAIAASKAVHEERMAEIDALTEEEKNVVDFTPDEELLGGG